MKTLFDLPPEVRNAIYQLSFENVQVKFMPPLHRAGESPAGCINILLASRKCLSEARPIFLSTATLDVSRLIDPISATLDPILDPSLIRTMRVYAHTLVSEKENVVSDLLRSLANLTCMTITGFREYHLQPKHFNLMEHCNEYGRFSDSLELVQNTVVNANGLSYISKFPRRLAGRDPKGRAELGGSALPLVLWTRMVEKRDFKVFSEVAICLKDVQGLDHMHSVSTPAQLLKEPLMTLLEGYLRLRDGDDCYPQGARTAWLC